MSTIKTGTISGHPESNKLTVPSTLTVGNTIITNGSAGSTTITAEGGSTTTNLQQGLCKTWADYGGSSDGNSTIVLSDTFNVGGITDNGTGDYTFTHANDMASGNYVFVAGNQYETGAVGSILTLRIKSGSTGNKAAASMRVASEYSNIGASGENIAYDYAQQQFAVHGDLA
tara:strand:- start:65 stop:580 length:516 start_codon:yes stop_codon:yes gene_type:complete